MKLLSLFFESLVAEGMPGATAGLPLFWMLIYHEGMRSNHLIFERDDLEKFDQDQSRTPLLEGEADQNRVSDVMCDLLSSSDLECVRSQIRDLPYRLRKQVFHVYLRLLERWRYQINQSLN